MLAISVNYRKKGIALHISCLFESCGTVTRCDLVTGAEYRMSGTQKSILAAKVEEVLG